MFKYQVKFYDSIDGDQTEVGIVAGENFSDAVKTLSNYFGHDMYAVEVEQLNFDDEYGLISLPEIKNAFNLEE